MKPTEFAQRVNSRLLGTNRIIPKPDTDPYHSPNEISPDHYRQLADRDRLELRMTRRLILDLLGVKNFSDIPDLLNNPQTREKLRQAITERYPETYGIEGDIALKEAMIKNSLGVADRVVDSFENRQTGVLKALRGSIAMTNEVAIADDLVELLSLCFSPTASRKTRFEASRKLQLTDLALRTFAHVEKLKPMMAEFITFLNSCVWSNPELGGTEEIEVASYHSPVDFSCRFIQVLEEDECVPVSEFCHYHRFSMRSWQNTQNREKQTMFDHRQKDMAAYVLKLLRKDTKNPNISADFFGFKFTFLTKREIYEFLDVLQIVASQNGISLAFEEIDDTIDNGDDFRITNPGSSKNLEIVKVHLTFQGTKIELQLHTVRSYLDSVLRDEVGHEEFSIRRLFERGNYQESPVELLYPADIYGEELQHYYPELINKVRASKRRQLNILPPERARKKRQEIEYGETDLAADTAKILDQITEIPDTIIAIGNSGLPLARELSNRFGGIPISIVNGSHSLETTTQQIENDGYNNVLIVDDVGEKCINIKKVRTQIPQAKVAVIAKRSSPESNQCIDYWARELTTNQWIRFNWDRGLREQQPQVFTAGIVYRITDDQKIQILVVQMADGRFKLPGGAKEFEDDNLKATIVRELKEEISLTPQAIIKLSDHSYNHPSNHIYPKGFVRGFAVRVNANQQFSITGNDEVTNAQWVSPEEAQNLLSQKFYLEPLKAWLEELQLS